VRSRLQALQTPLEAYIHAAEALIAVAGDSDKAVPQLKAFQTAFEALEKPMASMSDYLENQVKQRKEEVDAATRFSELLIIGITLSGAALIAALALTVLSSVTGSIKGVQRAVDDLRMGSGDLTYRLPPMKGEFDALSHSLNQFISGLHDIVSRVRDSAMAIGSSSQQVEQGNRSLSERTEAQASGLEESAASMEEFTATVKSNAESAQRANELAQGASAVAVRGGNTVRGVVTTMEGISESSRQIADIIGVIDSIAFQTNILALNAAVEAARAGEQGRGFAVVASEVRALAQRSAQAAREIKALIQTSVEKVDSGTRYVGDAGKTMDDIVNAVREVSEIVSNISVSSREQLAGIEQVNRAIAGMDTTTQQNAALVEQSATASEHMANQAQELVAAVARFKLHASTTTQFAQTHASTPSHASAAHLARSNKTGNLTAQDAATRRLATAPAHAALAPNHSARANDADGEWKAI
jgi:methyl-accepting chemotaxis protein